MKSLMLLGIRNGIQTYDKTYMEMCYRNSMKGIRGLSSRRREATVGKIWKLEAARVKPVQLFIIGPLSLKRRALKSTKNNFIIKQ